MSMEIKTTADPYALEADYILPQAPHSQSGSPVKETFADIAAIYTRSDPTDAPVYSAKEVCMATAAAGTYSKLKTYLKDLGFYNGAITDDYTAEFKKSLICFQQAYGSDYGVSKVFTVDNGIPNIVQYWIQKVGAAYYTHLTDGKAAAALKALGFTNPTVETRRNFAQIWTFLEKGMGCTAHQIAGVMGNLMQESQFDPTMVNGQGAYGILQWSGARRGYLEEFAKKNGGDETSMGTQLAFFRYEVSRVWGAGDIEENAGNSELVKAWEKIMAACKTDYNRASDIFYEDIESPSSEDATGPVRRTYAKSIYNAIK